MRTGAAVASSSSSSFIWSLFIPVCRTSRKRYLQFLNRGIFLIFSYRYSTLLHLPPLRFCCVRGCWDRTQDCLRFQHRQPDAPNHSARSHPHSARSHPHSARSHPLSARFHPLYAISKLFLEVSRVSTFSICTAYELVPTPNFCLCLPVCD
jgi:hypothetical protein